VAYWLLKSEPESWSWEQQKKKGAKGEPWSGVRNHQAKLNLMAMKKGERAFFYHSGKERRIVGIVEVIGEYRPDPTDASGKFGLVVVKAVRDLEKPVTLGEGAECFRGTLNLPGRKRPVPSLPGKGKRLGHALVSSLDSVLDQRRGAAEAAAQFGDQRGLAVARVGAQIVDLDLQGR